MIACCTSSERVASSFGDSWPPWTSETSFSIKARMSEFGGCWTKSAYACSGTPKPAGTRS